jgi:hypothetical protein
LQGKREVTSIHEDSSMGKIDEGNNEKTSKKYKNILEYKYEKTTSLVTVVLKRKGGYVHSGASKGSQYEAKHNSRMVSSQARIRRSE